MRTISFVAILLFFLHCDNVEGKKINLGVFHSDKVNIKYSVDIGESIWGISPEEKPDILQVYCESTDVKVSFYLKKQTIQFMLNEDDTVNFVIVLNHKDSAFTQVIGVKTLPNKISKEDRVYHLSRLWSEVKYNFVNIDKINFNWDSLYLSYIPQVEAAANDFIFYRLLQRFLASLHDGHTQVFLPKQFQGYQDYIPIGIGAFDNRLYVLDIQKNIGLDSTLLGAEIVAVDDIPIEIYLKDSVIPYISASTPQSLWMQIPGELGFNLRSKLFEATLKKTNGDLVNISIKRNGEATRTENDQYYFLVEKTSDDWQYVKLKWLVDSTLHLEVNSFYPDDVIIKELSARQDEIRKSKNLILDLRKNGGGITDVAFFLQYFLTKGSYFLNFGAEIRINDGYKKSQGNWREEYEDFYLEGAYRKENADTIYVPDSIHRFTMPIVILIGEYTFSAAEDFLVNIYEVPGRPTLIGNPTGGSSGAPLMVFDLKGDVFARICTVRLLFPYSKKAFVNEGITPDIIVPKTFDSYCHQKDAALEAAVKYLNPKK
jgi:C-terminal processing protease CtpA/Prc